MHLVATLIAGTEGPALNDSTVAEAAGDLNHEVDWLAPGRAADLLLAGGNAAEIEAGIRRRLAGRPVDVVVQGRADRRKKLLVADMDSTIITVECIDALAARAGIGEKIAAITARTIRGELNFEDSLRERVALLSGTPIAALEDAWRQDVALTPGACSLIATMRAHGAMTALISGGFTWFTERVAEAAGFDLHRANTLIIEDGRLAGRVEEPVLGRDAKETMLRGLIDEQGLSLADSLAVGDGANDIAMLKVAGLGVAYHGVDAVREVADARIEHGDLTALLYLQGYRQSELVNGAAVV
jgi:phosphoserine phosphatase